MSDPFSRINVRNDPPDFLTNMSEELREVAEAAIAEYGTGDFWIDEAVPPCREFTFSIRHSRKGTTKFWAIFDRLEKEMGKAA